jgi:NADPH2:quinone reductase|tara:strand:- start:909 stop:1880 length:972 start_codon:yes stop_codon:yes gene_type:complete
MPHAIRISEHGGPEVLNWEEVPLVDPGPGEVRVSQSHIGLNFIDIYQRTGLYPMDLPATLGMEAAGNIDALGDGVTEFSIGDRVAYAAAPPGAYTDLRIIPADRVVPLPDSISAQTAAAMMLQGMTAEYLIRRTYRVQSGDTVLFHAAAGGVGLIACQWLKQIGATVIGTVGSEEKAELAKVHGCDYPIIYTQENFAERVREITDGKGVPVVYDSVGQSTFEGSMDCLAPLGIFVSFGNSSGPIPVLNPGILAQKGSLYFTRPTLMTYTAERDDLLTSASALFEAVEKGLKIEVNQTFPLENTADAHSALEGRQTTGSTVLTP